jgi:hypothetical protein
MTFLISQPKGVPAARLGQIAQHTRSGGHRHLHAGRDPGSGNGRCRCVLTNPTCPPHAQECHPRAGR